VHTIAIMDKNAASSNERSRRFCVWHVVPIWEVSRMLLGNKGAFFRSTLLELRMVLPTEFHKNQPSRFISRSSRRFRGET